MNQSITQLGTPPARRATRTRTGLLSGLVAFWAQFRRRPYGMVGLIILILYAIMALAAPWLTPYKPDEMYLADRLAAPVWARYLPRFKGAPPTLRYTIGPGQWDLTRHENASLTRATDQERGELTVVQLSPVLPGEAPATAELSFPVHYPHNPPNTFDAKITYAVEAPVDAQTTLSYSIIDPQGTEYTVWDTTVYGSSDWNTATIDSRDFQVKMKLGLSFFDDPATTVFATKGDYRLVLRVSSTAASGPVRVRLAGLQANILGLLHGLLGTDHVGSDLWTQLVYGARISLIIGILAAIAAVAIGTVIGLISGYLGGKIDEFFMRVADVFLSVPTLPILIILSAFLGKHIGNIVLLVAAFSWMTTARVVRSQTLSLKQRAFVEAARAAGAGNTYIMLTHLLPNVFPLVVANTVLMMPVAILYEAALSFLGLGDPRIPTWGRMLQNARAFGAFTELAWWWLVPPGLAITLLTLSFTLIGNAVNEVLNPRYRERT
ncbi:MAG: ABC transporter permease [Limnochordales bacterium]|nr:ABC transporter permease [Limnochordales bacterium]